MDTIPTEILEHIIDSLAELHKWGKNLVRRKYYRAKFAPYASISRAWKASIEQLTFQDLTITTNELNTFGSLFNGENITRRIYLTSLTVNFVLPSTPNALGCCPVVNIPDREFDSIVFSASLTKLFTILADMEARTTETSPLTLLFFEAQRHGEYRGGKYLAWTKCKPRKHSRREMLEAKAVSGHFELVCEEVIPSLPGVTSLEFKGHDELGDLKPSWVPVLVSRLPSLEKLLLRTEDLYAAGRHERLAHRAYFAASICSLTGNHLRKIRLDIYHYRMGNENLPVHKLVDCDQWAQESWFRVMSHMATFPNLAILQLQGGLVVCPNFFRCITDYSGTPFRALVEFELEFAAETADGRWYHERDDEAIQRSRSDPDYESFWEEYRETEGQERRGSTGSLDSEQCVRVFEDEPFRTEVVLQEQFRSIPNTATLLPFLVHASKAVARVPSLRKFILRLGRYGEHKHLTYSPIISRVFELWYLKAGMPRTRKNTSWGFDPQITRDSAYLNRNRLYWRVDGWKPWEEAQSAWGAVAGPDAKTVFLDESKWVHDPSRSCFHFYEGEF